MGVVVVDDVAHTLVQHGEERVERPEAGEVHDVLVLLGGPLQALDHQAVRREVGAKHVGAVHLHLFR